MLRRFIDPTLGRRIGGLAYPIAVAMLTQTGINVIDTIMVGHLSPEYSIAGQTAIGISLILLWAIGGTLSTMIAVGTQALSARRYGEGDEHAAGQVVNHAAIFGLVISIVATAIVLLSLEYLFPQIHSNPRVVELGVEYSEYRFYGLVSMVVTIVFKGFFDGIGRTKVHMVAAIVMNCVNIILNYCLIFGVGPFPQMNVAGAGLASLIATYVGLAVMLWFTFVPSTRRKFRLYRRSGYRWSITSSIIKVGVPGGIATLFLMTGFAFFWGIVARLDMNMIASATRELPQYIDMSLAVFASHPEQIWTHALKVQVIDANPPIYSAATKVIMDVMSVIAVTCIALGQATATLVSQSMGSGNSTLAERYGWTAAKIGMLIMTFVALIIVMLPEHTTRLFNPDPDVISAGKQALRMMGASSPIVAIGLVLMQSLFGAGETTFVMVAELVLHFCCLVPVAYLFGIVWNGGVFGVWGAVLLYVLLLTGAMVWKFWSGTGKTRKI